MSTWRIVRGGTSALYGTPRTVPPSTGGHLYDDLRMTEPARPLSALPSPLARALAFVGIVLGGAAGGLIGFALVDLQCSGACDVPIGIGVLIGSVVAALGTAVVAVLVLRAQGEWREIQDRS
jgi:hypothetical protein